MFLGIKIHHLEKRTMDYNDDSYEWNDQDSMRNKIGKNYYPESNTIKWRTTDLIRDNKK